MTLDEITSAGHTIDRINSRLGSLLEDKTREDLAHVDAIMLEVRHFAVCWGEAAVVGEARAAADPALNATTGAREHREACIERLVEFIRPR